MTSHPGRSRLRRALSRPPGWLTVLGLVLMLGEIAGAAMLAGCAHGVTHATAAPHAGTPLPQNGADTVLLRVEGKVQIPPGAGVCAAMTVPRRYCEVTYTSPTGGNKINVNSLPFVKAIRVHPGGSVTLSEFVLADPVTCSITVDGQVLSRFTSHGGPDPSCRSTIPSGGSQSTRTVVLRADGVPVQGIPCSPTCSPQVAYTTPTGSGGDSGPGPGTPGGGLFPYTKTVRVQPGGSVTLKASYVGDQTISCSIAVDGKVLDRNTSSSGPDTVEATCRATIP